MSLQDLKDLYPHHAASPIVAAAILADSHTKYTNFQVLGIAQLAAVTSVPKDHRADFIQSWQKIAKSVTPNTPGSSMLLEQIKAMVKAVEAQPDQMPKSQNGVGATEQHKPLPASNPNKPGSSRALMG